MRDVFFSILSFFLAALLMTSCVQQKGYITITGYAQGGTYAVKLNMEGVDTEPSEIAAEVEAILKNIDNSLSGYNTILYTSFDLLCRKRSITECLAK